MGHTYSISEIRRSVWGQILWAALLTVGAITALSTGYCYGNEFGGFSLWGTGHELPWHRPDLEMAQMIADDSALFQAALSLVMTALNRAVGLWGFAPCVLLLLYYSTPRF